MAPEGAPAQLASNRVHGDGANPASQGRWLPHPRDPRQELTEHLVDQVLVLGVGPEQTPHEPVHLEPESVVQERRARAVPGLHLEQGVPVQVGTTGGR